MIEFKNIRKVYDKGTVALDDIDLEIDTGEFISFVGQSGAGKSTLLRLLFAEEKPTSGSVMIDGWDITAIQRWQIPFLRRQIGVVFQDFKLLSQKTAAENIAFAMEVTGEETAEITKSVPQMLRLVNLADKADHYPWQLSGGEQQRVALARALANEPQSLRADEPTGTLDARNAWDIIHLLLKVNKLGTTVLLASHDEAIVNAVKKRVVTMDKGKIIRDQRSGKYSL